MPARSQSGRRVLVIGLGIEGVALTRYFASRGADVIVNDVRGAEELASATAALDGASFRPAFGGHDLGLLDEADAVFVSQGVPLSLPLVVEARRRGIPIGSIATLLYDICKGRIVGISGSAGKTTTTSLVAAMFGHSDRPWLLAGNIGHWPLDEVEAVSPETWVVVEMSHTQLQLTTRSPQVACVTNVTPNHLDQFSWDEYVGLKRNLVRHQTRHDTAVLGFDNEVARGLALDTPADVVYFSSRGETPGDGAFCRRERIVCRRHGKELDVVGTDAVRVPGRHNLDNVLAATAVAAVCGIPTTSVAAAVGEFRGVPHRLEVVATADGVTFVNDSIATAPERTLAALRSFAAPIVLLLGGRDKQLPLEELAGEAADRCRAVVCFGEAGDLFAGSMRAPGTVVERVDTLDEAVRRAVGLAQTGDVVLLAPAGTSFDAYPNFEHRGDHFRALVSEITRASGPGVHRSRG